MAEIFRPPEINGVGGEPIIYLAGPIQGAPDWQNLAIRMLRSYGNDFDIASPRRQDDPAINQAGSRWYEEYRQRTRDFGVMLHWMACRTEPISTDYARTSRVELGEDIGAWKAQRFDMVVGIEPGFSGEEDLIARMARHCPGIPVLNSLAETCSTAHSYINTY